VNSTPEIARPHRAGPDWPFYTGLLLLSGVYVVLIVALVLANFAFIREGALRGSGSPNPFLAALSSAEIQYAIRLSLLSCTVSTVLSLWVAVPLGYLLSRFQFPGKRLVDTIIDIPIVLPPLVIGLSLLILFRSGPGIWVEEQFTALTGSRITYAVPGVILAQFMVACAFAVRTMRATFDEINPRSEQVALTLGCSRGQAFWMVALPEARRGLLVAATLAWARSLGEFGPILIFAGATRFKTEVMPTTVFLLMSVGDIEGAVAVSMLMIGAAVGVLVLVRLFGQERFMR
jgi:molybdate transport system permease protein